MALAGLMGKHTIKSLGEKDNVMISWETYQ